MLEETFISLVRRVKNLLLLCSIVFIGLGISSARKTVSQNRLTNYDGEIAGVRFAVPQDFKVEQSSDVTIAFMQHVTQQVALFVAVPNHKVDDKYLTNLSNNLVSRLLPRENGFAWKILQRSVSGRKSTYQTSDGTLKGLNAKRFVQTDYIVVRAQGHEVIVGSIATFGDQRDGKFLFDVEGREYSIVGWQGLFHLIGSVTCEKIQG